MSESRYFLTVDWCNKGNRGIFCSQDGCPFSKPDEAHTEDESWDILGPFDMILSPQSILLSEEELKAYNRWVPLAEYSGKYGIAVKGDGKGGN